jgi:isoquinoline 1-oxidoreductase subunit alpha
MAFMLKINGTPHEIDVDGDTPAVGAARCTRHDPDQVRLRQGAVRRLHRACQRRGDAVLHYHGRQHRQSAITTIEAIGRTPQGAALQKAWLELEVVQCGYCQSGQIMSAAALLKDTPKPTDNDIGAAMSGNVCRCGTYQRIRAAIKHAAGV